MRIFLDTNVLLDFVCRREGFYADARIVFMHIYMGRCEAAQSALSYITACYVAKHYDKSQEDMSKALCDIREVTKTMALTDDIIERVLLSDWEDKEDAAQYFSAIDYSADYIITRNPSDFKRSAVRVITPHDFAEMTKS